MHTVPAILKVSEPKVRLSVEIFCVVCVSVRSFLPPRATRQRRWRLPHDAAVSVTEPPSVFAVFVPRAVSPARAVYRGT